MKILAIDSSAKAASAAVGDEGRLLAQCFQCCGLTHSRTLMPMIEDLLKNCSLSISDIGCVAVSVGPGSFTGLRIGIAAAKGIAWARGLPCCGVSTLEAMAQQLIHFEGIICAAMDARRQQVYNALFMSEQGRLTRLCPDRAISLEELKTELEKMEKSIIIVGDGGELCYNYLEDPGITLAPPHLLQQNACGVLLVAERMAAAGETQPPQFLMPNYLRVSQAERERLSKNMSP